MKTFAKRAAITAGILLTALVCMGIVYIDTVQNFWYVNSGFVKLIVSNRTDQAIMTVDTNTLSVGFNTNNSARSFVLTGRKPTNSPSGTAPTAATTGAVVFNSGAGGDVVAADFGSGGTAGTLALNGGVGGTAPFATEDASGGAGGPITLTAGAGGATTVATNSFVGGNGGSLTLIAGSGGVPALAGTNMSSGGGGNVTITAGQSSAPGSGWSRKSQNGGNFTVTSGSSGNTIRTNSGNGGTMSFGAGSSGNITTAPGNPGTAGTISFNAGNGGTGGTNANGGSIFMLGGSSAATPGDTVIGRNVTGTSRGGLMIGPEASVSAVSITNILGASASLDFGSVAAGTVFDLPITVTGVTSNNVAVSLSVPWQSASGGGSFSTFNSNDSVYVRFVNNNPVTAIDPNPGTFTVVGFRIR